MKKIILLAAAIMVFGSACKKNKPAAGGIDGIPGSMPRTEVPAELRGTWMYGNFSTTEYWSQNPGDYLGNALEVAIAFKFNADGTFEQYFTSGSVLGGVTTYQQSVTKGTVEIDPATHSIKAHAYKAHYKSTRNGQTVQERDLTQEEITMLTNYTYETGTETNGTAAIYLTMNGTANALTFLKK